MPDHPASHYIPQNAMSLWWLGDPLSPRLIGQISLTDGNRKVALEYAPEWLATKPRGATVWSGGFALSEDLPMHRGIFIPAEKDMAAGAVDDARPDRWGERVIRLIDRPQRLSLLEFLYFAGENRFGAMGISLNANTYAPRQQDPVPTFEGLADMERAIKNVLANEAVPEVHRRLLQPGASFGGARPKSLIQINDHPWVVKFSEGEDLDTPLVEHATMQLARRCGIRTAQTMALPVSSGHAIAVSRFDRAHGQRVHAISAQVALRACGETFGYPELAQLLRRLGRPEAIRAQQEELFRRMVFNILMDNTDDHEKIMHWSEALTGFMPCQKPLTWCRQSRACATSKCE
jgi:serine/threonine-protein kinase HipA